MSSVIINSTPIIGLSIIGKIHLVNELFEKVYVPHAVYQEITANSKREFGKNELDEAVESGKFQLYNVKNNEMVKNMYGKLHEGELEVIVGAKELGLRYVIMDERAARNLAQTFLLRPIGTLGILMLAKQQSKIIEIKPYLDTLLEYDFFISKKLYQQTLSLVGEV